MTRPRHAFVTGGGSGIGRALVVRLARRGVRVVAADIDLEGAEETARIAGEMARATKLDVTDRDAFAHAIGEAEQRDGPLDLLVNNAGLGIAGEARDMQPQDWRRVIDVNLYGVVHGVDAVYPRMIARRDGHIVNVASLAGLIPLPGESVYVASKHAVVGYTRTLRAEAEGHGVRVSLVSPGVVDTPIYDTSPVVGFDKEASLSLWPTGISPEACAGEILRAIDRGAPEVVITRMARLLAAVHRASPSLFRRAATLYMTRLRKTRRE